MLQKVIFDTQARKSLQKGVDTVANTVKGTMGHAGRAVLLPKATPQFTLDGVTVAQAIGKLLNPVEDMGAQLIKNVAQKTNDEAGDGTTTASVLLQALLTEGLRGIEAGIDPIILKGAFQEGSEIVLDVLKASAIPVKTKEQMKAIATISSRDPEIGEVIATIYDKIGKDGIITAEEVPMIGLDHEIVEGMQVDNGWMIPHFQTNMERGTAEIENPYILVTTQAIRTNADIVGILDQVTMTDSKSLIIIAEDIQGEALASMALNKIQGRMNTLVIKAPGYGDNKKAHLEDICAITGATLITEDVGLRVEEVTLEQCGRARRVVAHKNRSIIVGGKSDKKKVANQVASIKNELKDTASTYAKSNLERRLAKLKGGVAIIKVGDVTEEASREKQYRIEDAVNATKSAIEEGVVIGGGMALYEASKVLDKLINATSDQNYRFGIQALQKALQRPAQQILENEGREAKVVLAGDRKLPKGVIDPFKVERVALQQAVSVGGLFLITKAVVYNEEEVKNVQAK
jgi:chaperonin GroEL